MNTVKKGKVERPSEKMVFTEDKFVNGELVYKSGVVYEIKGSSIERWLKRGGKIVVEDVVLPTAPVEPSAPPVDPPAPVKPGPVAAAKPVHKHQPQVLHRKPAQK